jgi:hypothetical protein
MMQKSKRSSDFAVGAGLLLSFFAIPHLIDDFLFNIPAEFGLTNQSAQALGGVFAIFLVLSIVLAGRNQKVGYYALLVLGVFLTLAGVLKHVPRMIKPGPYWSGWFSEMLIYGLIAAGLLCALASISAIRSLKASA